MSHAPRATVSFLLTCLLALSAALLAPPPASADPAGSLSGRITADGATLPSYDGIAVKLDELRSDGGWTARTDEAPIQADGTYSFAGLGKGTFRVGVADASDTWATTWYGNTHYQPRAQPIVLDADVTGVDIDVKRNGALSGHVTAAGGVDLDGIDVRVYVNLVEGDGWARVASGTTAAGGRYTIEGVPPGTYAVRFNADLVRDESTAVPKNIYATETYANALTLGRATPVTVEAGKVTGAVDAELAVSGTISGTVLGSDGQPGAGAEVRVYAPAVGASGWEQVRSVSVGADGSYFVGALLAGDYRLGYDTYGRHEMSHFWGGGTSVAEAATIVVAAGRSETGKDVKLEKYASISGRVTDASGRGAAGVLVRIHWLRNGNWDEAQNHAVTDEHGDYVFPQLVADTYILQFHDDVSSEYWKNQGRFDDAVPIVLARSQAVTGVDAQLIPGEHDAVPPVQPPVDAPVAPPVVVPPAAAPAPVAPAAAPVVPAAAPVVPAPTALAIAKAPQPSAKGATVGKKITVTPGTWNVPVKVKYQWFANGKAIKKATKPGFTPGKAQQGAKITVAVTATAAGMKPTTTKVKIKGKVKG